MATATASTNSAVPTVSTSVDAIFGGQPKDVLWKSLTVPVLDWNDVGIDCFLGRGAFTHVHKGKITHRKQSRKKTMSSIESTVATSQSSFSLVSANSSSSSIESIPLDDETVTTGKPHSVDSELTGFTSSESSSSPRKRLSPSNSKQLQNLCAIKCINPTKTKRKEALISASNDLLNEAMLLSELVPHEHIVNFLGILPQEADDDDDCEDNSTPGMYQKEKVVQDYVLVLECLDETLSARLKRWRKEQLQMQKQQQEIWMAQELVLEQSDRLTSTSRNAPMGRRRLGTRARNLWRRLNNNGPIINTPVAPPPPAPAKRGRWGRLIHRGEAAQPTPKEPTNTDASTRVDDYRELVNAETNEFRWKQMNERMETIALGIVAGMKHMHDHQVVHRDLKPQNIGFDLHNGQTVKLFDFGLARQLPYNVQTATATMYYSSRRRSSLGSSLGSSNGGRRRSNSIGSGPGGRSNSIGSLRRSNSIGNRRRSNSIGNRRQSNGSSTGGSSDNHAVPPNPTVGEVVGTWRYMAPETMRSMGSDYASDMFSFAIMWSEICTLQRPYFQDEDDEDDELIHPATATKSSRSASAEKNQKNRYGPYENWNHLKSCILEEGHRPNLQSMPKHKATSDMQMWINQCWDAEPYRRPTFDSLHQLLEHYCKEHPSGLATI